MTAQWGKCPNLFKGRGVPDARFGHKGRFDNRKKKKGGGGGGGSQKDGRAPGADLGKQHRHVQSGFLSLEFNLKNSVQFTKFPNFLR